MKASPYLFFNCPLTYSSVCSIAIFMYPSRHARIPAHEDQRYQNNQWMYGSIVHAILNQLEHTNHQSDVYLRQNLPLAFVAKWYFSALQRWKSDSTDYWYQVRRLFYHTKPAYGPYFHSPPWEPNFIISQKTGKKYLFHPFPKSYKLEKGRSLWKVNIPQQCSWCWRKILKLREFTRQFIKFKVGSGCNIYLWLDNWHPDGILYEMAFLLYMMQVVI